MYRSNIFRDLTIQNSESSLLPMWEIIEVPNLQKKKQFVGAPEKIKFETEERNTMEQ